MLQGGRGGFEHREIKIVAGSSRYMENIQNEQIKPYINNICTNPTPAILLCGHKLYTPDPKEKNTALSTMAYIYQLLPASTKKKHVKYNGRGNELYNHMKINAFS